MYLPFTRRLVEQFIALHGQSNSIVFNATKAPRYLTNMQLPVMQTASYGDDKVHTACSCRL
jgi:hypothetical protein